ncbi:MAG: tRNA (adenosine(37)-N6)-threonylcarbamoyltransferase complex dimerization subunit type 1 TsaB [Planctomycetes bacterium]|jgi:tRNA threonylcarbamoyladenosine biosynthesis protein TsaB|nr:tRNA (adenosine(37)-N6)-threonylcarbamoyltransferase complex dimerization subunit type 1 TsaB [Planctomycetota bacterium]
MSDPAVATSKLATGELALSGSNLCGDLPFAVALRCGERVFAAASPAGGRGDLAGLVAGVTKAAGLRPEQLTALRVDLGPGSYTGLRVAITFVRFLQRFGALPVQGCCSLALLAARARPAARIRVVLDARRDRFHTACFAAVGDTPMVELEAPAAVPLPVLLAAVRPGELCLLPHALEPVLGPALRERGATVRAERELHAAELFGAGLPLFAAAAGELEPRYLMASYAEGG